MAELIIKLHTASRRYCIDKSKYWHIKYHELIDYKMDRDKDGYTKEAVNIFPRYLLLDAILLEIEKFTQLDFASLSEAKEIIIIAIESAKNDFMLNQFNDIAKNAMQEERLIFIEYISKLKEKDLVNVPSLFYRKILTNDERKRLWEDISVAWSINDKYWFPLEKVNSVNLIAFNNTCFEKEFGYDLLSSVLQEQGIKQIWELREGSIGYEIDIEAFEPYYNIAGEGYLFSQKKDWIIYVSHENSITIGGDWLIEKIKSLWTNWKGGIWENS